MQTINLFDRILPMIGNTPLLKISLKYKGRLHNIFAKAEYYNITGSIKDRVAYYILKEAYNTNAITPSSVISEATSGNTGISFAALGSYLGHKVIIFMPEWMSKERINIMKSYGAEVRLVSKAEGGFLGSIDMAKNVNNAFLPSQFSNINNVNAHYHLTASEILRQFETLNLTVDAVVAGVGTGGTIMGLAKRLKEANKSLKAYPLEPLNSPTLSTGFKVGAHKIQGISDEFIPEILKLNTLEHVISVDDNDSIIMAQMLSQKLGIGVGISSGANLLGAIKVQEEIGLNANVVTVFADDNKKYLSTDYSDKLPIKSDYMTNDIELVSLEAIR